MFVSTALLWQFVLAAEPTPYDPFRLSETVRRFSFSKIEDRDFDRIPDDWLRRRGSRFPSYVRVEIDRRVGSGALGVDVNGGAVAMYSPVLRADGHHAYLLKAKIRTENLSSDAALISLSFLDSRRRRIARRVTKAVTGTHRAWVNVLIDTFGAPKETRFVVVGCHVVPGDQPDLKGRVWFDDIHVARLPRLKLVSNYHTHFIRPSARLKIECSVSGLQPGNLNRATEALASRLSGGGLSQIANPWLDEKSSHDLHLSVRNRDGALVGQRSFPLEREATRTITWSLPPQPYGYYEVTAELTRRSNREQREVVLRQATSLVVLDLVDEPASGDFGWLAFRGLRHVPRKELPDIAKQGGVNYLGIPLWNEPSDTAGPEIGRLLTELSKRSINSVGLLHNPPEKLRSRFRKDWRGTGEIFQASPKIWVPFLEGVLARHSVAVRHWYLGDDGSFDSMDRPGRVSRRVKAQFDKIGRDTRVVIPWKNLAVAPRDLDARGIVAMNLGSRHPSEAQRPPKGDMWFVLQPLNNRNHTLDARAADLVRRMVAARVAGAKAIFLRDLDDEHHGVLRGDGAPNLLFLPWRTTCLALRGTEYLGDWNLPSGIENRWFVRKGEAILVLWNTHPKKDTIQEELVVGANAQVIDIWGGRPKRVFDPVKGTLSVTVGRLPVFIRHADPSLARFRASVRFEKDRLGSKYGRQDLKLIGTNRFPQGVTGTIKVIPPKDWQLTRSDFALKVGAGEKIQIPLQVSLPPGVDLGKHWVKLEYTITADQRYRFVDWRPIRVGVGDLHLRAVTAPLPDGRLQVKQTLINNTNPPEELSFRCTLFVPGTPRQKRLVVRLGPGKDVQSYFLADAQQFAGRELWIRAEQVRGPRVLNFRFRVPAAGKPAAAPR